MTPLQRALRIQALVLRGVPVALARAMVNGAFRGRMDKSTHTPSVPAGMGFVNCVPVRGGRVVAICQCCGRRSRSCRPDKDGEPALWEIGRGWSEAPYSHDFKHDDGSTGSTFTCPACNTRLKAGEALKMRNYRREAA